MLLVLVALLYLYASAGLRMLSTWRQTQRDTAEVRALETEHARLEAQRSRLAASETVELEARRLGMIRQGERPYLTPDPPSN